jgi:hypothetical protein
MHFYSKHKAQLIVYISNKCYLTKQKNNQTTDEKKFSTILNDRFNAGICL